MRFDQERCPILESPFTSSERKPRQRNHRAVNAVAGSRRKLVAYSERHLITDNTRAITPTQPRVHAVSRLSPAATPRRHSNGRVDD
jgi:hypothetical protein